LNEVQAHAHELRSDPSISEKNGQTTQIISISHHLEEGWHIEEELRIPMAV
jgi:hypothetical protein